MKIILKVITKLVFCFSLCGGLYLLLELAWKQHSDISMFAIAGCMGIIAMLLNNIFSYETDFLLQCGICTVIATIGEGLIGNAINMDFSIWNYSSLPFSFWNDQINLFFCGVWFVLFFIFIPILDYIEWKLFNYKPYTVPYYKIGGRIRFDMEDISKLLN